MKKFILGLLLAFLFMSCISTNVKVEGGVKSVSTSIDNLEKTADKNYFFTEHEYKNKYFKSVDALIASSIKNNLTKPVLIEGLSKKNRLEYNPKTLEITFFEDYERRKNGVFVSKAYKFKIEPKEDFIYYIKWTSDYEKLVSSAFRLEELSKLQLQPVIEKLRRVPFTSYRTVHRSAYVDGQYISYQETVPYTDYRLEKYMAPNPDYNPIASVENAKKANEFREKANKVYASISNLVPFNLYFN